MNNSGEREEIIEEGRREKIELVRHVQKGDPVKRGEGRIKEREEKD